MIQPGRLAQHRRRIAFAPGRLPDGIGPGDEVAAEEFDGGDDGNDFQGRVRSARREPKRGQKRPQRDQPYDNFGINLMPGHVGSFRFRFMAGHEAAGVARRHHEAEQGWDREVTLPGPIGVLHQPQPDPRQQGQSDQSTAGTAPSSRAYCAHKARSQLQISSDVRLNRGARKLV